MDSQVRKPRKLSWSGRKNHGTQKRRSTGVVGKQLQRLHQYGHVRGAKIEDGSTSRDGPRNARGGPFPCQAPAHCLSAAAFDKK